MRMTYDRVANAFYLYLIDEKPQPGGESVPVDPPEGIQAFVVMDWRDGRIVGLEVLDASGICIQTYLLRRKSSPDAPRSGGWGHSPTDEMVGERGLSLQRLTATSQRLSMALPRTSSSSRGLSWFDGCSPASF